MICTFSEIFDAVFNDIRVKYKVKILGKMPCLCSPISELHSKLIFVLLSGHVYCLRLYQPVQDLATECETRSVVFYSHLLLLTSYFLSHCFRLSLVKITHRLAPVIEMEAEETFTLLREEKISQRRHQYTEDDIFRRFFVSLTFPNISYMFGLENVKVRKKQKT